jgi:maltooligosyltrehalose trehalohydrolase
MVALTGEREATYFDYRGTAQELLSAVKYGFLYQSQWHSWQRQSRGKPGLDIPPPAFIAFIQNHDQISNSARGLRAHLLTSPGRYRAMNTLLLLAPWTPMLFQGQEFASSAPFLYFADHKPELAALVQRGRNEFLQQFPSVADPAMQDYLSVPHDPRTFASCRIDCGTALHAEAYQFTDLLRLRREDLVFRSQKHKGVDGATFNDQSMVLRFFADDGMDRLLLINFGVTLNLADFAEQLLAPPENAEWQVRLSTTSPQYGGHGIGPFDLSGDRCES